MLTNDIQIDKEDDILNEETRRRIIAQINSPNNAARKKEMYKRYLIYKDKTKDFVLESIRKEMGDDTAEEILQRTPNLSICRKIINKKAMVYKDGVKRTTKKGDQNKLDILIDLLNHNTKMKKVNKFVELFKNTIAQTIPYKDKSDNKYEILTKILPPFLFDVVVDSQNKERAICYITSDLKESDELFYAGIGDERIHSKYAPMKKTLTDNRPTDYIWWSTNYHFTTDEKGKVVSGDGKGDGKNPIKELPYTMFAGDQDGSYWALGGDDLVDTSILINLLLADLFYIAKYQGMGILYMTGKGVNNDQKVGPNSIIAIEQREGEPTPTVGFASSNPPIGDHLSMIKEVLMYLLDTNDLSYGGGNVDSGASAQSGIQEIIKRSDNIESVEDQREMYRDKDPLIIRKAIKWANVYSEKNLLKDEWKDVGIMNPKMEIAINFPAPQPFTSDLDKLAVIEKRIELGLDTMIDAIKKDNPDLTEREAKLKLKELLMEKVEKQREAMKQFGVNNVDTEQDNQDNKTNRSRSEDREDEETTIRGEEDTE